MDTANMDVVDETVIDIDDTGSNLQSKKKKNNLQPKEGTKLRTEIAETFTLDVEDGENQFDYEQENGSDDN